MCGFHEVCFVNLMEQGGKQTGCQKQPKTQVEACASSLVQRNFVLPRALGPVFTLAGITLSPDITDVLRGSHSKDLCGAH